MNRTLQLPDGHVAFAGPLAQTLNSWVPGSYFGPVPQFDANACVLQPTLHNMILAGQLEFPDVPSPIAYDYNWPGMFKPRAHQRHTAEFLTTHPKAFVLSDMGTGKTASALWAADYLISKGYVRKVLILGTVSTLKPTWMRECNRLLLHRSASVLYGAASTRKKLAKGDADIFILNHDGLAIVADELKARGDIDLVIIDEGSYYRNSKTEKYTVLEKFLRSYQNKQWLWVLTAAPCPNEPPEAFSLAKLVSPHRVPKYYGTFREMTMYKVSQYRWEPRPGAMDTVYSALQPAIRYKKSDCIDLPPTTYVLKQVPLSDDQRKAYKDMKAAFLHTRDGTVVKAVNAAVQVGKLLQIAAGVVRFGNEEEEKLHFDVNARLNAVLEYVVESQSKVVVLVPYTAALKRVVEFLESKGYSCGVVDGSVQGNARATVIENFVSHKDPKVLVCNPKAAAHGLNLQVADTLVWYSPVLSLDTYLQACERIAREGQMNKMVIGEIASTKLEAKFYDALRAGEKFHEQLLDMYNEILVDAASQ